MASTSTMAALYAALATTKVITVDEAIFTKGLASVDWTKTESYQSLINDLESSNNGYDIEKLKELCINKINQCNNIETTVIPTKIEEFKDKSSTKTQLQSDKYTLENNIVSKNNVLLDLQEDCRLLQLHLKTLKEEAVLEKIKNKKSSEDLQTSISNNLDDVMKKLDDEEENLALRKLDNDARRKKLNDMISFMNEKDQHSKEMVVKVHEWSLAIEENTEHIYKQIEAYQTRQHRQESHISEELLKESNLLDRKNEYSIAINQYKSINNEENSILSTKVLHEYNSSESLLLQQVKLSKQKLALIGTNQSKLKADITHLTEKKSSLLADIDSLKKELSEEETKCRHLQQSRKKSTAL